ncbi:hypothetical protein HG536_0B03950 [Torulaspora globosa]|uniref:PH domain-containing protein n=1 Tax=Torulaspora globosa TaxID=48254 RepID=A0A7G3ZDE5_9SACH|nr:uncharacterized protein HG536_0B03950 [Torulaspora globosa]QLL31531.1 hypothetical protein HG536_0B03950 [Torulaspora globosa]
MVGDNADETMDSLLKEIDDEMENTIPLDSQILKQDQGEKNTRRWSIPLQEIGDETMEMLVSHNTIRNIKIKDASEFQKLEQEGKESTPLPSMRKSVVFSEGVNFHEYADGSADEQKDSDHESVKIDTTWKRSSFVPATELPNELNQSLIVETPSDSDEGQEEHDLVLTTQDLLEHTVADLDQKLSHMFDANRNAHRLKLATEEMDEVAPERREPPKIEYTLQSTKPLTVGTSGKVEEAGLIHFQTTEDAVEAHDDEDQDAELSTEYMDEIRHSPSKIPLTNTVSINNFSIAQQGGDPQTRLSSGSSCCDSVADLKTTIQHDRYNLLESTNNLAAQREENYYSDTGSFSRHETLATHPNASRIFSVATSGDGYKSAKETAYSVCSACSIEGAPVRPVAKLAEGSVEDLDISAGLLKNGDSTSTIAENSRLEDESVFTDNGELSSHEIYHPPQLPQLPILALRRIERQPIRIAEEYSEAKETEISRDNQTRETISADSVEEQTADELAVHSPSDQIVEGCTAIMKLQDQEDSSCQNSIADQEASQNSSINCSKTYIAEPTGQADLLSEVQPANSDKGCSAPNDRQTVDTENGNEIESPMLPRVARMGSLFLDNPFMDDFDTSAESIDLTRSVKPSDYLSIWHMQEEDIKSTSPALSSNSQFSRYTNSTDTSAVNSNLEHTFKFKPRVISRSKYYYPEPRYETSNYNDEYVITRPETALDPLRRNTNISKKIQENIKNQRRLFATLHNLREGYELEENCDQEAKLNDKDDQSLIEGTDSAELSNTRETGNNQLQLLPSLPDFELGEEFATYLEVATNDNRSILHPSKDEQGNYSVWNHNIELGTPTAPAKNNVSIDAIHKLLGDENKTTELLETDARSVGSNNVIGVLKTPVKEVSVGRGLSLKGYEAMVSEGFGSEGYSRSIKKHGSEEAALDPLSISPSPSPVKKTHVGSPFKVKTRRNDICHEKTKSNNQPPEDDSRREDKLEVEDFHLSSCNEPQAESACVTDDLDQRTVLPDRGNLYLKLKNITDLLLQNVKYHKAEFSVEFDNGMDTIQTTWQPMTSNDRCDIDKEFEIILANDMKKISKLIITLRCRYQSPKFELQEVVEKIPVGRKFPFGKSKFEYQKRFVQKSPTQDEWDFLFARDGSFGRCEINLDEAFLGGVKFRNKLLTFTMVNEWARKPDPLSSKKLHELPRRSPYAIGALNIEACYLERTSPLEKFPKTLQIARSIISKYMQQQAIFKEGYMLQEGGDVQSNIQRRFFRLQGNNMLGYHEITRQPKLAVNLLKVVKVFGPGDIPKGGERNLTDLVLFSGCFHLVFDNEERITFSTESPKDGEDWCNKISEVISLNRCHQPWVKYFHQSIDLDH